MPSPTYGLEQIEIDALEETRNLVQPPLASPIPIRAVEVRPAIRVDYVYLPRDQITPQTLQVMRYYSSGNHDVYRVPLPAELDVLERITNPRYKGVLQIRTDQGENHA